MPLALGSTVSHHERGRILPGRLGHLLDGGLIGMDGYPGHPRHLQFQGLIRLRGVNESRHPEAAFAGLGGEGRKNNLESAGWTFSVAVFSLPSGSSRTLACILPKALRSTMTSQLICW